MNTHARDNPNELRTGGIAIASQAALDFVYASSASQFARVAAVAGKSPRLNAAGTAWAMATLAGQLLKAGSGTSTSTSAVNLDTYAMASGLTANDTVRVFACVGATTQAGNGVSLYNATDSVTLGTFATLAVSEVQVADVVIRQRQTAATAVLSLMLSGDAGGAVTAATFTTAWTGAWTLALRSAGVTAGGTLDWSWAVYQIAGQ